MPVVANGDKSMTAREWAMLLTLSVLWGGSFFFNGVAVRELPTLTIVVSRVALAAFVLLSILRLRRSGIANLLDLWPSFFIMAVLNNVVPFSLFVWAQSHIASGVAAILNATTPLFTVVVAHHLTSARALPSLHHRPSGCLADDRGRDRLRLSRARRRPNLKQVLAGG